MAIFFKPVFLLLLSPARAAITVLLDPVPPTPLNTTTLVHTSQELWLKSSPEESRLDIHSNQLPVVITSSYTSGTLPPNIHATSASLVRGAIDAWTQHRHLELRPDEVWFEILAQMNFYMSAHAEDVRKQFVDFEGKKAIYVEDLSWELVLAGIGRAIQKSVKTDWLREWVIPGFSTSTHHDELTASVLLMGLMQHYFEFYGEVTCGIPSVTLLGTREDWVALLKKTDRLHEFGAEPADYANNLRALLSRFVLTFDKPDSDEVRDFWRGIVRARQRFRCGGPKPYTVTGWLVGFLHWREDGSLRDSQFSLRMKEGVMMTYDNITDLSERMEHLPVGYAKAPMTLVNYPEDGVNTSSYVLAGNIGKQVRPGVAPSYLEAIERDKNAEFAARTVEDETTVRPMSSWFLYAPVDFEAKKGSAIGSQDEIWSLERALDTLKCAAGNFRL